MTDLADAARLAHLIREGYAMVKRLTIIMLLLTVIPAVFFYIQEKGFIRNAESATGIVERVYDKRPPVGVHIATFVSIKYKLNNNFLRCDTRIYWWDFCKPRLGDSVTVLVNPSAHPSCKIDRVIYRHRHSVLIFLCAFILWIVAAIAIYLHEHRG